MAFNMVDLLPLSMRNLFWTQFIEAYETEYNLLKAEIEYKQNTFLVETLADLQDRDQLIEVAKSFGYTPDTSLREDDYDFLIQEIYSIFFRIKAKTTPLSWEYIFNTVPSPGEVSILYSDGQNLIRNNGEYTLEDKSWDEPFLLPGETLVDFLEAFITLDDSPVYQLDGVPAWTLDQETSRIPTSHLSVEQQTETLTIVESEYFFAIKSHMDFLLNASHVNRKVTDTPHVGSQINFVMDSSNYFDNANQGAAYSVPDLRLFCSTTPDWDFNNTLPETIEVGTGSQALRAYGGATAYPTELANSIYSQIIFDDNSDTRNEGPESWHRLSAVIPSNTIEESLGTGDDSTQSFSGTLNFVPIIPGTVAITYEYLSVEYTITDDGEGNLSGNFATGTINYTTGAYSFDTYKTFKSVQTLHSGYIGDAEQNGVDQVTGTLGFTPVTASSMTVSFGTGGGANFYYVTDNGLGEFDEGDGIAGSPVSTIDYVTGAYEINFSDTTDNGRDIVCEFEATKSSTPDSGTIIEASYAVEDEDTYITEAGVFDDGGLLVAYATFPKINLGSFKYEYFLNFFIRESPFTP